MTALFGMAMVIIGSKTPTTQAGGAKLIVDLADQLSTALHPAAKWAFLLGAWGAIFSSLLGVWQSIPYLFADFWGLFFRGRTPAAEGRTIDTRSLPYRLYLFALATVPAAGMFWMDFKQAQEVDAVVGALCIPMLALVLLALNGRSKLVGRACRNSWLVSLLLIGALAFFAYAGWLGIQ